MSTKKIEEALTLALAGPDADAARVANAALKELAAIRKACEDLRAWSYIELATFDPEEKARVLAAQALVEAIAKEGA